MILLNRLKEARRAKGLTQIDVAKYIGITQGGYSGWERGDIKIDSVSLGRLAELFEVTTDYLLCKEDADALGAVRIPVLGSIPAGVPLEAIEDVVDWEDIPRAMTSGGKEFFALRVSGDSMWPDILAGDTVVVRKAETCQNGDVCVVYVNGSDATLKEVRRDDERKTLTILPRNPNYPPRTFSAEEIADLPVSIAGVVVELRRKIKK